MGKLFDLVRYGFRIKEGKHGIPPSAEKHGQGKTAYDTFLSSERSGKKAFENMLSIGGEIHDGGPDPIKFIKQFDPQNSSGVAKEALDIMEKLQNATEASDLMSSIEPLQNILGGSLYSALKGIGASTKSSAKTQKQQTENIIGKLIAAAMANLIPKEREPAAEKLTKLEIDKIRAAYYGNQIYTSNGETEPFKREINKLMPIFRKIYGTK